MSVVVVRIPLCGGKRKLTDTCFFDSRLGVIGMSSVLLCMPCVSGAFSVVGSNHNNKKISFVSVPVLPNALSLFFLVA